MPRYEKLEKPENGARIEVNSEGTMVVPDFPIIPFIEGDGVGPEICAATRRVVDAAVERAFKAKRGIVWWEIYAGEKARRLYGADESLPDDTFQAIQECGVAIKGPLETPIGGGIRSLNMALRIKLDLFAGLRPCRWIKGVPSPVKSPEKLDVVVFRENSEDLHSGYEWPAGSLEAKRLISFLRSELMTDISRDSGLGLKRISEAGSRRLVRIAIRYALANKRSRVTLVHKGNIMKFTEGAFRDWGYQLAKDEFPEQCLTEAEVNETHGGKIPKGKVMINDCIADSMLRQLLLSPEDFDILACPNLNGDYISDACAAQVGGPGMAPCANLGEKVAVFETVHGTCPKHAGKDAANPGALVLAGKMLLDYLGWGKAGQLVEKGIQGAVEAKTVPFDFERHMEKSTLVKCSEYAEAIVRHMS